MFRLLRSDVYRIVRGKMLVVVPLVLACWTAFMAWVTRYAIDTFGSDMFEVVNPGLIDAVTGQISQSMEFTSQFGTDIVAGGGILVVLACLFCALFAAFDTDTGFVKSVFSVLRGRAAYYVEKFLFIALFCLVFMVFAAAVFYAAMRVAGFGFASFNWPIVLEWFCVVWLLVTGYAFLSAAAVWLTRSKALGCVVAILLSTSFLGTTLLGIFALMTETDFTLAVLNVLDWMPFRSLSVVASGALAFSADAPMQMGLTDLVAFAPSTAGGMWGDTNIPVVTHMLITIAGMWVLSFALTFGISMRRDV